MFRSMAMAIMERNPLLFPMSSFKCQMATLAKTTESLRTNIEQLGQHLTEIIQS